MNEPTIATLLEEIQVALEGKQRVHYSPAFPGDPLGALGTLYKEPDPAYNRLKALVAEEYWEPQGFPRARTAYWEAAPNKALEGALIGALGPIADGSDGLLSPGYPPIDLLQNLLELPGDTKVQALKVVLEWLEGERMNTSRHKGSAAERVRE